jgi:alkylglycerol monooxygenase
MNLSPVVIAIPMYFILMAVEMIIIRFQKKSFYRLNDSITNINCGVLSQVTGVFVKVLSIGIYTLFYENFAIFNINSNIWTFLLLFFLYDLCYYWAHRMSHEINLFWGGHVVHHSSEEYNLSVALRQSSTQTFWTFFFYFPLAFLGFDPMSLVLVSGLNLLYQFWIHTETIGKMGFLEKFMNTPSHHRVHHGRNPKYIDKNHGGTFIIFDKIFGTFKEEEETPVYGITTPVKSWNPIWINISHYVTIKNEIHQIKDWKNKVRYLFKKPGWLPEDLGGYRAPSEVSDAYQKYDTLVPAPLNWYVFFQYMALMGLTAFFLFNHTKMDYLLIALLSLIIIWTTVSFSAIFEKNKWYTVQEAIRVLAFASSLFIFKDFGASESTIIFGILIYSIVSLFWLGLNIKIVRKFQTTL